MKNLMSLLTVAFICVGVILFGSMTTIHATHNGIDGLKANKITIANLIPEPITMLLLGAGLIGLAGLGRRKSKKNDFYFLLKK
ncbi:MAG: PEP-CTERM sorting domain-containing protein [Desulfobacteraceae bacterium]